MFSTIAGICILIILALTEIIFLIGFIKSFFMKDYGFMAIMTLLIIAFSGAICLVCYKMIGA